ncbi:MAG TPA: alpha/beta hydrolase [Candidatus Corynebacterium avicola]|uniref:Alpha/beta hydrolase n=1 Tax=Candidatus Corynebacterium avicola TaxID=2838527 RepID=A0A9D1RQY7_9CORY|nr:alpha/beta hydrolase [Candidatus Corynebacterium avicola]
MTAPAILTAATVAFAGMPTAVSDATSVPQPEASQDITWEDCPAQVTDERAECGRIDVPMYHSEPEGEKISVGFVRIPASSPDARRGTLLAVPGGPGDSAYSYAVNPDSVVGLPEDIRSEWDVVGVQPRGLNGSTPLDCDHEPEGWDPVRAQLIEPGLHLKEACEIGTPGYTDAINTWEISEDMDAVREALNEEKVSLHGVSYGTLLGSTYATKFPEHTDRLVLDSGMDTTLTWADTLDDQTEGYTNALHDFLEWAAEHDDEYGLGATSLEVYQSWSAKIVEESGTNPTVVPPPAEIGDLPEGLQIAGQPAADVLTAAGAPAAKIENLFRMLITPGAVQSNSSTMLATQQALPQPNYWGQLADLVGGNQPVPTQEEVEAAEAQAAEQNQGGTDPTLLMQQMMFCNENQVAPDLTRLPTALWNSTVEKDPFSLSGDVAKANINCNGIDADATITDLDGSALDTTPLQIQGTGDPQTPYSKFGPMAESMGSHVITVNGPGHGQVGVGNQVVDDAVVEYLRTGSTDVTSAPSRPIG